MRKIAALFVRADSVYKRLPMVDAWDIERDARQWPGGCPVVAHPPCRAWGRLRAFANPRPDEKELAIWAIEQVRRYGGVLEHPAHSTLWDEISLPTGKRIDEHGGFTLHVNQSWWGHKAAKQTFLYVCGISPRQIPLMPLTMHDPQYVVSSTRGRLKKPEVTKAEREHTPPALAEWLVELARRC